MTRRILMSILPLMVLVGCPEPETEAPGQPGGPPPAGGEAVPAMNADGAMPPPGGEGGAPPVPEGTAPGAQDGDGNPGEAPPDGALPDGNEPPPTATAPMPEGGIEVPAGENPDLEAVPMGDEKAATGLAPDEQQIPCGDGTCDDAEKQDPKLCPRDCATPPASGDWCGDGVCDALEEHKGNCAQDCK